MRVMIPVDFHQPYQWIGHLDALSAGSVGAGVFITLKVLTDPASWWVKTPEMLLAMGLGLSFGLTRWPLDGHGDVPYVWAKRAIRYYWRDRRSSEFGANS